VNEWWGWGTTISACNDYIVDVDCNNDNESVATNHCYWNGSCVDINSCTDYLQADCQTNTFGINPSKWCDRDGSSCINDTFSQCSDYSNDYLCTTTNPNWYNNCLFEATNWCYTVSSCLSYMDSSSCNRDTKEVGTCSWIGGSCIVTNPIISAIWTTSSIWDYGSIIVIENLTSVWWLLYMSAKDEANWREPRVSDGSSTPTLLKNIRTSSNNSEPYWYFELNGKVCFSAINNNLKRAIFETDGSEWNTIQIYEGLNWITPSTDFVTIWWDLYFVWYTTNFVNTYLYKFNVNTQILTQIKYVGSTIIGYRQDLNLIVQWESGTIYFSADSKLRKSNGTTIWTEIIKDFTENWGGSIRNLVYTNNVLFFMASDGIFWAELWKSNWSTLWTRLLKDIYPWSNGSSPIELVAWSDWYVYFCSDYPSYSLWKTDGYITELIKEVNVNTLIEYNWYMYFIWRTDMYGRELWRTDGSEQGTIMVNDLAPGWWGWVIAWDRISPTTQIIWQDNNLFFFGRTVLGESQIQSHTTSPKPSKTCWDGTVDNNLWEQCDDGNTNNNDDCTNYCRDATCGDGFTRNEQAGTEECDNWWYLNTLNVWCTSSCATNTGDFACNFDETADPIVLTKKRKLRHRLWLIADWYIEGINIRLWSILEWTNAICLWEVDNNTKVASQTTPLNTATIAAWLRTKLSNGDIYLGKVGAPVSMPISNAEDDFSNRIAGVSKFGDSTEDLYFKSYKWRKQFIDICGESIWTIKPGIALSTFSSTDKIANPSNRSATTKTISLANIWYYCLATSHASWFTAEFWSWNETTMIFDGEWATQDPVVTKEFYSWCYAPVQIRVWAPDIKTNSVDSKFFMSGFIFQNDTTNYTWFVEWDFETYKSFWNVAWRDARLWSWTATSGSNIGENYIYINAISSYWNEQSWNIHIATFYVKPNMNYNTWYMDFYMLWARVNDDDSTVSSGIKSDLLLLYTQYNDDLFAVANTGAYTFLTGFECPFRPYIKDTAEYVSTLWYPMNSQNNFTWLQDYSLLKNRATTDYYGDITIKAWPNLDEQIDYNSKDSWHIRTRENVILNITGSESIKIDSWTLNWPNFTHSGSNDRSDTHTFLISDNITSWYLSFYNNISNLWYTYESGASLYENIFYVDVRRIDRTAPLVSTSSVAGIGYEDVTLSGSATWFATWTIDDDQFRIVKFSWHNTLNYVYFGNTTEYNAVLNSQYTSVTGQDFDMLHTIHFTETWSWYVYVSDIAGNTGKVFIDVKVEPLVSFKIIWEPAFRETTANWNLSITWEIRLATLSWSTWVFKHNSKNIITHSWVVLNSEWTGEVSMVVPKLWADFLVVFKWTWALSVWFTWVWYNDISDTGTNYFDFTSWTNNIWQSLSELFPSVVFWSTEFIIAWDVSVTTSWQYDRINAADLTAINDSLVIGLTPSINYYDFDLNSVINAIEQGIIINYHEANGWIDMYWDGIDYPNKAAFDNVYL